MTNRRHFYSFKINQNASAQNFSQNPPCPDKPGKPLFLRIHAVRHNNAFCNGRPASRSCCRSAPKLRLHGTKILPFLQNSPGVNSRQPIPPKLRLHGTIMLPLSKLARHKKSVVVSLGVVFRKLNEFQQKLHPCVHTQLLINIVYRLFNGSFGYK